MFTGLIESTGTLLAMRPQAEGCTLHIQWKDLNDAKVGDSICVNGICLTVTSRSHNTFTCDVMHETLQRTTFQHLKIHQVLNLEKALRLGDRLDGHLVSGHIDGIATLDARTRDGIAECLRFRASPSLCAGMVEKGSITIDGISLTLIEASSHHFSVSIIPHTMHHTNLAHLRCGDFVNIECDLVGKYVFRYCTLQQNSRNLHEQEPEALPDASARLWSLLHNT